MRKAAHSFLSLLLIAGAFLAGSWYGQRGGLEPAKPGSRGILRQGNPARLAYTSGTPERAAASRTPLGPVHGHGESTDSGQGPAFMLPRAVNITPEQQQLIGVRVSPAETVAGTQTLRLFGRVAPDETRIYKLNSGVDGFVREVSPVTIGSQVEKDQWLATFSSPESRAPIQAYLVTLNVLDRGLQSGTETPAQVRAAEASSELAIDRLLNLGMSRLQIEEIRRTREVAVNIRILAPAAGFVLVRNVSPGQKFERGTEFFRIADLSRVWVLADLFENEAPYVGPGARVRVSLPGQRNSLWARVADVLPQFDPVSRALKVRLEADNPAYVLRPDMFVDVELPITLPPAIAVPVDAVLDSGLSKTVFVARGEGVFEPRQVETGWRFGDRVEIVKGLEPGERIVVSGTFLLDSESRMKVAGAEKRGTPLFVDSAHSGGEGGTHGHGGHHP